MPKFTYRPMLRSRAGEATALTNLTVIAKSRMQPVVHLVHKPPATFGDAIIGAWKSLPIALDGTFQTDILGTAQPFTQMFDHLGKGGVRLIPSIEYGATPTYLAAVQKVRGRYAQGLIVKAKQNQLPSVASWIAAQGWTPNEVDLVVTLGEIAGYDPTMLAPVVVNSIASAFPAAPLWRSVTISASAAPKDHGNLSSGVNNVPRLEWPVWQHVAGSLPYLIDYADYSTIAPDLTDPPGYVMSRATVSVRYTIDGYWLIIKGKATSGKGGQAMTPQYLSHAKTLVAHPQFGGLVGCWGDGRIKQIAAGTQRPGTRALWASISASRHLSFIADRLP
jgi:hypothetical protein